MGIKDSGSECRATDITWHATGVSREERERLLSQKGCVIWLTGLSGSGKSTVANSLTKALINSGHLAYQLDGDNVRHGLNSDLAFTPEDRAENIRRVGEVAALFADAGVIAITSFISPYRSDRDRIRSLVSSERFIETFLNVPLEVCEQRDPKNLYKKARAGEITDFTGIQAPYEAPHDPEIELDTSQEDVEACTKAIVNYLTSNELIH